MRNNEKKLAQVEVSEADGQDSGLGIGSRIAPAVALLMLGESAFAGAPPEPDTEIGDDDTVAVPEPSVLSMLAVGAVVVGAAKYIQNKRRK